VEGLYGKIKYPYFTGVPFFLIRVHFFALSCCSIPVFHGLSNLVATGGGWVGEAQVIAMNVIFNNHLKNSLISRPCMV
jgi:hypothetical protein